MTKLQHSFSPHRIVDHLFGTCSLLACSCGSSSRFPCVPLKRPDVAGTGITCCPHLAPVFPRCTWYKKLEQPLKLTRHSSSITSRTADHLPLVDKWQVIQRFVPNLLAQTCASLSWWWPPGQVALMSNHLRYDERPAMTWCSIKCLYTPESKYPCLLRGLFAQPPSSSQNTCLPFRFGYS